MAKRSILILIFISLIISIPVYGKRPYLTNPHIFIRDDYLIVSTVLRDWLCDELKDILQSTIPVEITLRVRVFRHKSFWFNDRAYSATFTKRIEYDRRTKHFRIKYDDGNIDSQKQIIIESFEELINHISKFRVFIDLDKLDFYPKRKTFIRIRVNMTERYELFRIPGSFRTSWVKSDYFTLYELLKKS